MSKQEKVEPRDHGEALAVFRMQVIGELAARQLERGELAAALRELSEKRFRPPESPLTRSFSVPTLERWLYRYRQHGLGGLRPASREQGFGLALDEQKRELLLGIRRDHPGLSAARIVRTLVRRGQLEPREISANTVRRLYRAHGLDRLSLRSGSGEHTRRRWEAERPGQLWHCDVCHGPNLGSEGERRIPLRIHALLDDSSRFIVAVQALGTEREADMLALMVKAVREHGKPEMLYVDNGATYRGDTLSVVCSRLGIKLVHAQPYDPQARGKMERFWRTLREGCLDYLPAAASLHDVQVRLLAFIDRDYHLEAHSSLLGESPAQRWANHTCKRVDEPALRDALTVRFNRRIRRDGTLSVAGVDWELSQGFLAGRKVVVARSLLDPADPPWVEHDGKQLDLHRVDARANAKRRRPPRNARGADAIPFDPVAPLVDELVGRSPKGGAR